jgi:hypothetical protein
MCCCSEPPEEVRSFSVDYLLLALAHSCGSMSDFLRHLLYSLSFIQNIVQDDDGGDDDGDDKKV